MMSRKVPRVSNCCLCIDMTLAGSLLSIFGVITGFAYLSRAFYVLHSVHEFNNELEDDDAMKNDDDMICK